MSSFGIDQGIDFKEFLFEDARVSVSVVAPALVHFLANQLSSRHFESMFCMFIGCLPVVCLGKMPMDLLTVSEECGQPLVRLEWQRGEICWALMCCSAIAGKSGSYMFQLN